MNAFKQYLIIVIALFIQVHLLNKRKLRFKIEPN